MDDLVYREDDTGALDFTTRTWRDDVAFVVEDKQLYASKCVLAMYSPVFEKMFGSHFKEKQQTEIELPGKKAEDIMEFLQCLYPTATVSVTVENVRQILPLADEYQVATLMDECRKIIKKNFSNTETELTRRDIVEYFEAVTCHGLQEQGSLCVDEIVRQGNYEMISPAAEDLLNKDTLILLQKGIISKQEERLEDVTTKYVKLFVKTKDYMSKDISAFKNAKGATIEHTIADVFDSKLLNKCYSKPVKIWNVSFRISVYVAHGAASGQSDKYLSVFLECRFPDDDAGWSCDVEGDIVLENISADKKTVLTTKSVSSCNFTPEYLTHGFPSGERLSRFLTETGKTVERYSCKVVAYILAKTPKKDQIEQSD